MDTITISVSVLVDTLIRSSAHGFAEAGRNHFLKDLPSYSACKLEGHVKAENQRAFLVL